MYRSPVFRQSRLRRYAATGAVKILAVSTRDALPICQTCNAEGKRYRCGGRCLGRPDSTGPMLREKLATQLMEPVGSSPDELRARMDGEIERWAPVIKAAHVALN